MKRRRSRLAVIGVAALSLCVTTGLTAGVADAQKKKGKSKKSKTVRATGTPGAVPNGPAGPGVAAVPFRGTATVGGKLKGKVIGDIDVTLSATAAAAAGSENAIADLTVRITAPNGATTQLTTGGVGPFNVGGPLVSNLTFSDQTATFTCGSFTSATPPPPPPPPCVDPNATLGPPYTGTAEPQGLLNALNGSNAKGTYTLTAFDDDGSAVGDSGTTTITSWSVSVRGVTPQR